MSKTASEARLPKTGYVLLWFPKPSETFIFHEVIELRRKGLSLSVFALYGRLRRNLTREMAAASKEVERLGMPFLARVPCDLIYWFRRNPRTAKHLFRIVPLRRWRDIETAGENLWAFLCGFRLARLVERNRIEHIHAPWAGGPATAARVASSLTGRPFSFAAHATDIYPPGGALPEKIAASAFVRAESAANVAHLERYAGVHARKLNIVHNGQRLSQRREAEVAFGPPYKILALGRFVRKKGFEVLIRCCKILAERGPDWNLCLGGAGPAGPRLKRLTVQLGLGRHVTFPGYIRHDRVPEFLCTGDIFVMPSVVDPTGDRDGIPNVILEALLHRLPVVATDVCGIGEVIRDGDTGFLVPPQDPSALADAIERITHNMSSALAMAERGRSLVRREFDLDVTAGQMLKLFGEHTRFPRRKPGGNREDGH